MQFANINGHTIHYKYRFAKEHTQTFVFINSIGTDFRIWDDVANTLKKHGNVLLFDNRGHGLSSVVENTTGLNDYMNDTLALLDELSITKCILIGLSLGGMIGTLMATRSTERIEKLILCDTGYVIGNTSFWNNRIAAVKDKGLASVSSTVMPRWFSETFRNEQPVRISGYRNMLERMPVTGYLKACEAIRDANLKNIAANIKLPTLCVVGSEDASTTPDEVKALADAIEGAKYVVIEGSGHLPCVDNPEILSKLILEFVSS